MWLFFFQNYLNLYLSNKNLCVPVNMLQFGNFFADYWIFIFPFILAIFFICFKMFEKLPGAGLLTKKIIDKL
ncbi:hypothetical protein [Spiroplasma endosymbiont of Agriotes lineatus]|uniref:hypothetical protein n=1 Tax=Spiroplasma endosymbiont of Agriotes lineatus TaxID=3077930 RepID=UPI0030D0FCB6